MVYHDKILDLCLAQWFTHASTPHPTGLEVVKPGLDQNYNGMFIAYVDQIDRSVWIVPDFSSEKNDTNNLYHQYLVNTDSDRFSWINSKGESTNLPDNVYVEWKND